MYINHNQLYGREHPQILYPDIVFATKEKWNISYFSPWIFYYVPLKRQTSEMTSSGTSVGFRRTQIDPWDIIRLALIELIDSDMEIRREVFTLSESKISVPDEMKVTIVIHCHIA